MSNKRTWKKKYMPYLLSYRLGAIQGNCPFQQRSREVYGALASIASWHSKAQNNWDKKVISGVF